MSAHTYDPTSTNSNSISNTNTHYSHPHSSATSGDRSWYPSSSSQHDYYSNPAGTSGHHPHHQRGGYRPQSQSQPPQPPSNLNPYHPSAEHIGGSSEQQHHSHHYPSENPSAQHHHYGSSSSVGGGTSVGPNNNNHSRSSSPNAGVAPEFGSIMTDPHAPPHHQQPYPPPHAHAHAHAAYHHGYHPHHPGHMGGAPPSHHGGGMAPNGPPPGPHYDPNAYHASMMGEHDPNAPGMPPQPPEYGHHPYHGHPHAPPQHPYHQGHPVDPRSGMPDGSGGMSRPSSAYEGWGAQDEKGMPVEQYEGVPPPPHYGAEQHDAASAGGNSQGPPEGYDAWNMENGGRHRLPYQHPPHPYPPAYGMPPQGQPHPYEQHWRIDPNNSGDSMDGSKGPPPGYPVQGQGPPHPGPYYPPPPQHPQQGMMRPAPYRGGYPPYDPHRDQRHPYYAQYPPYDQGMGAHPHAASGMPMPPRYPDRRFNFSSYESGPPPGQHPAVQSQRSHESRSPSPASIPAPPKSSSRTPGVESKSKEDKEEALESTSSSGPLRESSRLNSKEKKEEAAKEGSKKSEESEKQHQQKTEEGQGEQDPNQPGGKKKAVKTMDAASILLEFQKVTNSTCSSPPTIIESATEDSNETITTAGTALTKQEGGERRSPPSVLDLAVKIPKKFPSRLSLPGDNVKLNSLHCFLRSELLEIFIIEQCDPSKKEKAATNDEAAGSAVGRVGLRCVHCAMARRRAGGIDRNEAPMAVFYPKSVADIYRLVTSWKRCHLRKCRNLPPPVRAEWDSLKNSDNSRGKTGYWISSAHEIGLVDIPTKAGGIRFNLPDEESEADETKRPSEGVEVSEANETVETSEKKDTAESEAPETEVSTKMETDDTDISKVKSESEDVKMNTNDDANMDPSESASDSADTTRIKNGNKYDSITFESSTQEEMPDTEAEYELPANDDEGDKMDEATAEPSHGDSVVVV